MCPVPKGMRHVPLAKAHLSGTKARIEQASQLDCTCFFFWGPLEAGVIP